MPRRKSPNSRKTGKTGKGGKAASATANQIRIIGGKWRSRKLPVLTSEGLRPTPDRVRETLFNWLQADIYNSKCLDLFAGTGALGLEALSRGAKDVTFVEKQAHVAAQLKQNLQLLSAPDTVINTDALDFLAQREQAFDLIFLDPPFHKNLLMPALQEILEHKLLKQDGLIYLEHETGAEAQWNEYPLEAVKQTRAGQVSSYLLKAV